MKDKNISKCCMAQLRVIGAEGKGTTRYYVCTKCNKACDTVIKSNKEVVEQVFNEDWRKRIEEARSDYHLTFRGGHDGEMYEAFAHGMDTVFNGMPGLVSELLQQERRKIRGEILRIYSLDVLDEANGIPTQFLDRLYKYLKS